jgi:hypothetical protein
MYEIAVLGCPVERSSTRFLRSLHTIEPNSAIGSFLHLLRFARIQPLQLSKFPES